MTKYEVCNQEYDKCPGCGQYKGQYHDGDCSYIKDEQKESALKNEDTEATNFVN